MVLWYCKGRGARVGPGCCPCSRKQGRGRGPATGVGGVRAVPEGWRQHWLISAWNTTARTLGWANMFACFVYQLTPHRGTSLPPHFFLSCQHNCPATRPHQPTFPPPNPTPPPQRNFLMYWRFPEYNLIRLLVTFMVAMLFGTLFFGEGTNRWAAGGVRVCMLCVFMVAGWLAGWVGGWLESGKGAAAQGYAVTSAVRRRAGPLHCSLPAQLLPLELTTFPCAVLVLNRPFLPPAPHPTPQEHRSGGD